MRTSERAMASIKEMPAKERSFSERFRLTGKAWAAAKREADLLEEMKGPRLEQLKTALLAKLTAAGETKVPESRLEREIKASKEWETYIQGLCFAQEKANDAWVERRAVELEHSEMVDFNANARHERRM